MLQKAEERETEDERKDKLNRELMELLNELRVFLPGVQVLFAFLLTVPFNQRFESVTPEQKAVFFCSILAATISSILLIAPGTLHRLRWRQHDKERLLRLGNRLAIAGTAALAVAIAAALWVVADVLYGPVASFIVTPVIVVILVVSWYVLAIGRANP